MTHPTRKKSPVNPDPEIHSTTFGIEELKALIALVGKEHFTEFEFESQDLKFRIRKEQPPTPVLFQTPSAPLSPPQVSPSSSPVATPPPPQLTEETGIHYVTSPIVGTFYRASSPSSPPFVQAGDRVKPGQTLCIVEAMKLMNEIECDVTGEITKILVENATPVEYGERLFAVRVS